MPVLTILNHGTANSTNTNTSHGNVLVISKIASLLDGGEGVDWILNEGAGTAELRAQGVNSSFVAGVGGGKGVAANVKRSVDWVKKRHAELDGMVSVNLAGHSRGSITAYKIARELCDHKDTANIPINIFAIDPVPGNTGHAFTKNGENYKNILLGGNVWLGNSFLLLAESEHRLVFRPYIDSLYSVGLPRHRLDTIPGTHGDINELGGSENEAAVIVLSRALEFLRSNHSPLKDSATAYILDEKKRLKKYAQLMYRLKKYKAHASLNPFKNPLGAIGNFAMSGAQVDRHRIANVQGKKEDFGPGMAGTPDSKAHLQERKHHHGLNMSEAVARVSPNGPADAAHATRPHRFFCNHDHQELFRNYYPSISVAVRGLEQPGYFQSQSAYIVMKMLGDWKGEYEAMGELEQAYLKRFLEKRGIDYAG